MDIIGHDNDIGNKTITHIQKIYLLDSLGDVNNDIVRQIER